MLSFICFKWERIKTGFQLPAVCNYTAHHVNVLRNMLERHVKIPHRLICVTDNPEHIDPRIETVDLWDKCRELGGCYNRLWVFSEEARELFGDRFVCIDLDCVIVKDCTDLFTRGDDFIINSYNPCARNPIDQHYNGSMFMVTAGARRHLWDDFDPESSPDIVQADPNTVGTDQAWIRHKLGKGEARWGNADGVYEARQINHYLLPDAKIIFFSGRRDPSENKYRWVQRHWL
jgi:hypothetical protein